MKLYKYFTLNDNFYSSIEESYLWFSKPSDFNDPFDCKLNLKKSENRAGEKVSKTISKHFTVKADPKVMDEFAYDAFKKVNEKLRNTFGVCCLSKINNDILMWSHYADKHRGVCVEFETEQLEIKYRNKNVILQPSKVNYSIEFPEHDPSIEDEKENLLSFINNVLLPKAHVWEYEKEFRYISPGYGKHHFNKKAIKKIIFGAQCTEEDKNKVIKALNKDGYNDVLYASIVLHPKNYQLLII